MSAEDLTDPSADLEPAPDLPDDVAETPDASVGAHASSATDADDVSRSTDDERAEPDIASESTDLSEEPSESDAPAVEAAESDEPAESDELRAEEAESDEPAESDDPTVEAAESDEPAESADPTVKAAESDEPADPTVEAAESDESADSGEQAVEAAGSDEPAERDEQRAEEAEGDEPAERDDQAVEAAESDEAPPETAGPDLSEQTSEGVDAPATALSEQTSEGVDAPVVDPAEQPSERSADPSDEPSSTSNPSGDPAADDDDPDDLADLDPDDPLTAMLAELDAPRRPAPAGVQLSDELPIDPEDDLRGVEGEASLRLVSILESLLFAAARPLKVQDLRKILAETSKHQIQLALAHLMAITKERGVMLAQVAGGFQFRTHPDNAVWVQKMLQSKPARLSRTQIETLAIVAYRQPITRPEIDDVRGVDSGAVLKGLLERELVQIVGKKEEPGRPLLYGTTVRFLEFFNLRGLRDLPTLRDFRDLSEESKATLRTQLGATEAEALGQGVLGFPAAAAEGPPQDMPQSEQPESTPVEIPSDAPQGEPGPVPTELPGDPTPDEIVPPAPERLPEPGPDEIRPPDPGTDSPSAPDEWQAPGPDIADVPGVEPDIGPGGDPPSEV